MMTKRLRKGAFLFFTISSCSGYGAQGLGCPYPDSEWQEAADRFTSAIGEDYGVGRRLDIECVEVGSAAGYRTQDGTLTAGEALWPGSSLARARIRVATGERYPEPTKTALAHEMMHLVLWLDGDPCYDHSEECGWDNDAIMEAME